MQQQGGKQQQQQQQNQSDKVYSIYILDNQYYFLLLEFD